MFALLAVLANMAIAVVSAQDPVSFNTSGTLFGSVGSLTSCDTSGPPSCGGDPSGEDLCCYESPGGLLVQTQFWDTKPSTGPNNSWTIHGLFPDNCDGTYESDCDPSRAYKGVSRLLQEQGAGDTLEYMKEYWIDNHGKNEHFWEHEWSKHGTCLSTLRPTCLPSGSPKGAEAVVFYQRVVELFKKLPTYDWLALHDIIPSETQTYTLSELTDALKAESGYTPSIACAHGGINQISWYFYLRGSLIDGEFVPIDAPKKSSCSPRNPLHYYPKSG